MEFHGYRSAEAAAIAQSKRDPSQTYYVNWIEDNEWEILTVSEHNDQAGYVNGVLTYPDADSIDLSDSTTRSVWLTDRSAFATRSSPKE